MNGSDAEAEDDVSRGSGIVSALASDPTVAESERFVDPRPERGAKLVRVLLRAVGGTIFVVFTDDDAAEPNYRIVNHSSYGVEIRQHKASGTFPPPFSHLLIFLITQFLAHFSAMHVYARGH